MRATREPVLSFGARAYVDIPYVFLSWALLVALRRPGAGAPVLVRLGLLGLLRPEAVAVRRPLRARDDVLHPGSTVKTTSA